MAGSVVWVDVLPSGRRYGPALSKLVVSSASSAGTSAGVALDAGIARGASRGSSVGKFFGGVAKTGLKATGILAGGVTAVGGAIATVAAKKGLDRLLDIDTAQQKLKGLGKTQADITSIMGSALDSVKGTAFGLGEAATIASGAVAAGVKPGQDLTKYLKLTADAASIAGTSLGDMGAIINKTTTSGKVYTDNLNQLADRGIPIFQWLQKEYGVSADELSTMVRKGQVDSATFRKVIEQNIGGAALASGDSVVGSAANMGAALGRLGAMFQKGAVAAAPTLFQSISGAIDRAGVALQPFADRVNGFVEPALKLVAARIDTLDFGKAIASGQAWVTKAVGWFQQVGTAVKGGDVSGLGGAFSGFVEAIKPLAPIGGAVLKSLGPLAGAISDTLVSAIALAKPLLEGMTSVFKWLGDHTGLLVPVVLGLAGAFLFMKVATGAAHVSAVAMLPITVAQIAADLARTRALTLNTRAMLANTAGEKRARIARLPATFDILAQGRALIFTRGAMIASTTASTIGAGALRLFGAAVRFAMGPIGIIITIIGLLVAGLVWFFTKTKLGQAIVTTVFTAIKTAALWLGQAFVWLWQNAISPALTAIGGAVSYVWSSYISPVFQLIGAILKAVGGAFLYLWSSYVSPVFQLVGAIFKWLWTGVVAPIGGFLIGFIVNRIGATFSWLWTAVISPVFRFIGAALSVLWTAVIRPVFGFVIALIRNTLGPIFSWLYTSIVKPVFDKIGSVVRVVWTSWLKPVFDKIVDVAKVAIPAAFTVMKDGIGKAWDLVKAVVKAPIRFVIDTVINDGIIDNFNRVAKFFKTDTMPRVALPKGFADGGYTGPGAKHKPAGVVHAGEYVLTKEQTARLGVGRIRAFASGMPGYATGGLVGAASSGWDWLAGKAGKAWNWAADAAGTAAGVVTDPAGTLGKLVKGIIGNIPGAGGMLDVAKGIGGKILDGALSALTSLGGTAGVFGGNGQNGQIPSSALGKANGFAPGPGVGPTGGLLRKAAAAAWNAASAASGGILRLTEGYRDLKAQQYRWSLFQRGGNLAAAPGTSKHGLGLAADVAGGQGWLRANGARFGWANTGLGFSQREPWHFEYNGAARAAANNTAGATLYDNGGYLPPGLSLVANKTGKPEPVLTNEQMSALRRNRGEGDSPLIGRDLVVKTTGGAPTTRKIKSTLRAIKRGRPSA